MAIRDNSIKKPFIQDKDTNTNIGLDLPIRRGSEFITGSIENIGYFASTFTTLEATKNNIRNLVNTSRGERFYYPTLGVGLKRYIFEQFNEDIKSQIIEEIHESFSYWLPYVDIKDLNVRMDDSDSNVSTNTLLVTMTFGITNNPNMLETIEMKIGE